MHAVVSSILIAALFVPGPVDRSDVPTVQRGTTRDLSKSPRLLNQPELVTADDYPPAAAFFDQQGSVVVVVAVNEQGRVADCIVVESSGYPALDSQTCRLMWLRARFEPGRDRAGRIATRPYRRKITWRLEGYEEAVPSTAWTSMTVWTVGRDGGLIACRSEAKGFEESIDDGCKHVGQLPADARRFGLGAKSDRLTIMIENQFAPEGMALAPHEPAGPNERVYSLQTSRLTIDSSGKVTECKPVEQAGLNQLVGHDSCEELVRWRFEVPQSQRTGIKPRGGLLRMGVWVSD